MNKIAKINVNEYQLTTEGGKSYASKMHLEKGKTWYVKFDKANESGRIFFNQAMIEAEIASKGVYEFESKTEHRVLGASNWRSRLTDDEAKRVADIEAELEAIKQLAMSRTPAKVDKNSAEYIQQQIAKMQAKLEALKA